MAEDLEDVGAQLLDRVEKARDDFTTFVEYVWSNDPNLQLASFHHEAIAALTDPTKPEVYWEAARGHAKTMLAQAYVCWRLGRNPLERVKILCANDKEARKRLYEIKQHIETNQMLQLVFPKLRKPTTGEWNKSRVTLDRDVAMKDPTIEAMGVLSGALGSRATIMVLDDVVDLRSTVLQPELKSHVRQKLFGEVMPLLEAGSKVVALGTPWTLDDCNALMKERFHCVGPHPVGKGADKFEPIWPCRFSRERLKHIHDNVIGAREYARAYLCQALTSDTVPVQPQWIQFYDAGLLGDPQELYCLQAYDLAIELRKENDFFANVTLLYDPKRRFVFVTDAWIDRLSFQQQATRIQAGAAAWLPQKIVLESGGYQGALRSYLIDQQVLWALHPFKTKGRNKERRLTEATPWLEQGRVFFHPKFDPRRNAAAVPIVSQLLTFPHDRHDDLVDALTMGLLVLTEEFAEEKEQDVNFYGTDVSNFRLSII